MNSRWLTFGFAISVAFNCAFLGAVGYRLWLRHQKLTLQEKNIHKGPKEKGFESLFLRSEQREDLRRLRKQLQPRILEIRNRLKEEREILGELLISDTIDTTMLQKQLEKVGRLQTEIEKEVIRELFYEREILDPEQRKHFLRIIVKRMQGDRHSISPDHQYIMEKWKQREIKNRRRRNEE